MCTIATSKRLHLLSSTTRPPLPNLAIRIVFELASALHAVRPLVQIPVWDGFALGRHCRAHGLAHGIVAHLLIGLVGEVGDLLVQARGCLCSRRAR